MTVEPIVVDAQGGEAWWFLGTLAIIRVSGEQTGGRYALFEALLPKDASPPLHSHPQDESFIVLEGELDISVGGHRSRATPGSIVFAPGSSPHSFLVLSESARVLILSTPAGIEHMVRALGTPAKARSLPPDELFPSDDQIEAVYKRLGMIVHGPPLSPT